MRVANIKTGSLSETKLKYVDLERMPCTYVELERAEKRKDWKWKVGCKFFGAANDVEYSFKVSKAGDTDNEKFWLRTTGVDFAVELIDVFRDGGERAVKEWISNGCP
jgi:hypothetical protein